MPKSSVIARRRVAAGNAEHDPAGSDAARPQVPAAPARAKAGAGKAKQTSRQKRKSR